LRDASESAAKYYDKKHQQRIYAVRDNVMLSSRYIRLRRASRKLSDKYLGPFPIIKKLGQNAYQLRLPKTYGRVHSTFHVSLLEPYRKRDGCDPPEPIEIDDEEEWEVDQILDVSGSQAKRKFLVRWKGCTREEDSWQPIGNLTNAKKAIHKFYRERKDAPRARKRRARDERESRSE
jgi:Chromo (CHRromatin Organisation MOdifier) domain